MLHENFFTSAVHPMAVATDRDIIVFKLHVILIF